MYETHLSSPLFRRRSRGACSPRELGGKVSGRRSHADSGDEAAAGFSHPTSLTSAKIKELIGIEVSADALTIKAATTYFDILQSADAKKAIPAIVHLTSVLGDPAGALIAAPSAARLPTMIRRRIIPPRCWRSDATVKTNKRSASWGTISSRAFSRPRWPMTRSLPRCHSRFRPRLVTAKMRHPASRFALTGVFVVKTKAGRHQGRRHGCFAKRRHAGTGNRGRA